MPPPQKLGHPRLEIESKVQAQSFEPAFISNDFQFFFWFPMPSFCFLQFWSLRKPVKKGSSAQLSQLDKQAEDAVTRRILHQRYQPFGLMSKHHCCGSYEYDYDGDFIRRFIGCHQSIWSKREIGLESRSPLGFCMVKVKS